MNKRKKKACPSPQEILRILFLKNQAFASLLDEDLLNTMTRDSEVVDYVPKDVIVKQHDPSDSLYIILSGRCAIYVNDKPLSQLEEGDMLGEMGLIQNTPRSATVIALEDTQALRVPQDAFDKMIQNSRLTSWMINLLTDRLKRSNYDAARALKEMEEILEDQMELGRVQRSLLPREMPQDTRFRIHVLYEPCAYVGGDYYDAIVTDDDRLFLIVADVTGHGAQASISMAIVRSFVHQKQFGKSPNTFLKRLNRHLFDYGPAQHFVTAQVAMIDLKNLTLHFAYAGHPPMLFMRSGSCKPLKGIRSFFLRFKLDAEFKSSSMKLKKGDRIAFYTDGVIEMFNPNGDMFNVEGLGNFMEQTKQQPISTLPSELETSLHKFREGSPIEDDITFMIVEIN